MTRADIPEETPEPEEGAIEFDPPSNDRYLMALVGVTTGTLTGEVALTIDFGGTVITGTVISPAAWRDRYLDSVASFAPDLAQTMREFYEAQDESRSAPENEGDETPPQPEYFIHFRDARIYQGQVAQATTFPLWRARVDHIVGWSLGEVR